jgi:hypothetical protein
MNSVPFMKPYDSLPCSQEHAATLLSHINPVSFLSFAADPEGDDGPHLDNDCTQLLPNDQVVSNTSAEVLRGTLLHFLFLVDIIGCAELLLYICCGVGHYVAGLVWHRCHRVPGALADTVIVNT